MSYPVYLDVLILIVRTFQEHLILQKVFQRFRDARINLSQEKCLLFQKEV
jgi:hypothetical protein